MKQNQSHSEVETGSEHRYSFDVQLTELGILYLEL